MSKIFLVHGHNESLLDSVINVLIKNGIDYTVLKEEAEIGRPIPMKFTEEVESCDYCIFLFTSDDMVCEGKQFLPRQNAILEAGFFIGKLGVNRVICVVQGNTLMPTILRSIMPINRIIESEFSSEIKDKIEFILNQDGFALVV